MSAESGNKLDRLLREAFPTVEVSPDFTLRLWRRLMKAPTRPPWMLPVPVAGLAVAVGVVIGIWTWTQVLQPTSALAQQIRWDLFGNAPLDTLAGSTLELMSAFSKPV